MKILMLTSRMDVGGAETHIETLCRAYRAQKEEAILVSCGGRTANALFDAGIRCVTLPLDRKDPLSLFRSLCGISRLIREEKPDILHSHSRIPSALCAFLKKRKPCRDIPLVVTAHLMYRKFPLCRKADIFGDATIAVSEDIRDALIEDPRVSPCRITVIGNGIDTERFSPAKDKTAARAALGLPSGVRLTVCASRSDESRGRLPLFLASHAAELMREGEMLLLLCTPALPSEKDLLPAITEAVTDANRRAGRETARVISRLTDVSPVFDAADAAIGVSRAAMEAMSAGLPVILAGNEGCAGLLTPENAERLSWGNFTCRGCEKDLSPVADAIERLRAPGVGERLGEFGRAFILSRFRSDAIARETLSLYRELLPAAVRRPLAVVCGYYGSSNLGDDAMAKGLCRQYGDAYSLLFVAKHPAVCRWRVGADAVGRLPLWRLYLKLRRASLFVLGGGNLMQDVTSFRSLLYYTLVFRLAKRAGCRTVVEANGIGPLTRGISRTLCRRVLRDADAVSWRESASLAFASRLYERSDYRLTPDPSLRMLLPPESRVAFLCDKAGLLPGRFFAVCPSSELDEPSEAALLSFCREKEAEGLRPLVLAMHRGFDAGICYRLTRACPTAVSLSRAHTPEEICGILGKAAFTVSARLHGGVLSYLAKTPFLLIEPTDSGKLTAFCRQAGRGAVLPMASLNADAMMSALDTQ